MLQHIGNVLSNAMNDLRFPNGKHNITTSNEVQINCKKKKIDDDLVLVFFEAGETIGGRLAVAIRKMKNTNRVYLCRR